MTIVNVMSSMSLLGSGSDCAYAIISGYADSHRILELALPFQGSAKTRQDGGLVESLRIAGRSP